MGRWSDEDSIDYEIVERKAKAKGLTLEQFLEQAILKHLHEVRNES